MTIPYVLLLFYLQLLAVPSGSLAEDPDVYAMQIHCSKYPVRCLERGEPQGPLRETDPEETRICPVRGANMRRYTKLNFQTSVTTLFYLQLLTSYIFPAVIVKSFIGTHHHKNAMLKSII